MLKVGILTYHFSDNYGALFQAYALRQFFVNQGHQAEFINYHPSYVEEGGSLKWNKLLSKDNLKIVYLKLTKIKEALFGNKKQKESFNLFRTQQLGVKGPEFKSLEALDDKLNGYDLFVCGSDQIWKPSEHYGVDPVYFLNFKQKDKTARKISYAPSFGKNTLDDEYKVETARLITTLDGVSVREQSGCDIVENLVGQAPSCVPDPTILLNDYQQIIKSYPLKSKKHVFCYALRSREAIGYVAEKVADRLDCALYSPHNSHRRWREIGETVYPCPQQWLYLLTEAEFVVTNSFHGTALSILQNKEFVVVGLQGSKERFNARVKNLLSLVGLESRFIAGVDENTVNNILSKPIDWKTVNNTVQSLRDSGYLYLNTQIDLV